ncbi:MAG: flagellar hook-associated protein FlgL [Betaproteobacteria bacterium]
MKISTALLFDRAASKMSTLQEQLVKSQDQLASGKQVLRPSDAPNQMATIARLNSLQVRHDNYLGNMNLIKARFETEEGAVSNSVDLLNRAKELVVQASSDTVSASDRQAIATELQGMREQLLSLANSQDTNGNHLFAGSRVRQPPFAPPASDPLASPLYQGDQTRMEVMIGDQRSLPINRSGSEVFVRVLRSDDAGQTQGVGFFEAFDGIIDAVKHSDAAKMQRGNGELDQMLEGLTLAQANIGTDMAILDHQSSSTEDTLITLKQTLSDVQDLDYAQAIAEMNKQMMSLEAAQSSFSKISQLSLFQYLR